MALTELGLTADQEEVYRTLLAAPDTDRSELARRCRLDPAELRPALEALARLDVLAADETQPSGFRLRRPGLALSDLADRRITDLVDGMHRIAELRAEILGLDEVAGQYRIATLERNEHVTAEVITGRQDVQSRLEDLAYLAHSSLDDFLPQSSRPGAAPGPDLLRTIRRGVRVRTLVDVDLLTWPPGPALLGRHLQAGVEIRAVAVRLDRLLVVDAETVVLPIDPASMPAGAIFVRSQAVARHVLQLFDLLWRRGQPVTLDGAAAASSVMALSDADKQILRAVMTAGNDEAAGEQLHLSARQVRRRLADMMTRLGATSRLQLGVLVERYGLLD